MKEKDSDYQFILEYLNKVEMLVNEMLELSNKGIKEFNQNDFLVLCGVIRDCAFKIKNNLNKTRNVGG